jgi:hypothetical protein
MLWRLHGLALRRQRLHADSHGSRPVLLELHANKHDYVRDKPRLRSFMALETEDAANQ